MLVHTPISHKLFLLPLSHCKLVCGHGLINTAKLHSQEPKSHDDQKSKPTTQINELKQALLYHKYANTTLEAVRGGFRRVCDVLYWVGDWYHPQWLFAVLLVIFTGPFGRRITFKQYSTGKEIEARIWWITPTHMRNFISQNRSSFSDPVNTERMWLHSGFRRVDWSLFDPLLRIPIRYGATVGFGSEPEYFASSARSSPVMYTLKFSEIMCAELEHGRIYLLVVRRENFRLPSETRYQWYMNGQPLLDDGSAVVGATKEQLVLEILLVKGEALLQVQMTTPGYTDEVRAILLKNKFGKLEPVVQK